MWSEEWDKKIREAAGQENHPADPEKGWQQMEPLLEKHLPQDRRKRRFFFLLFLLGGISAAVYFNLRSMQLPSPPVTAQPGRTNADPLPADASEKMQTISTDSINLQKQVAVNNNPAVPFTINSHSSQSLKNQHPQPRRNTEKSYSAERKSNSTVPAKDNNKLTGPTRSYITSSTKEVTPEDYSVQTSSNSEPVPSLKEPETILKDHDTTEIINAEAHETIIPRNDSAGHPPLQERAVEGSRRWGITLLGSADISGVSPSKRGDWRAAYGIGISYSINNRWSIRAGFIRSRKVYTAGGSDYNPPKRFWDYVSELDQVDANCLVYEIPLNVQYFFPGKKGEWFASAGLHSFLMKNETYHYDYKDMSGQERYMSQSYKNYSDHFLGVMNLSGGYRFTVSKNIKLSAEPYIQMPLGGVGYGKVKLYSGGVLFSATISR